MSVYSPIRFVLFASLLSGALSGGVAQETSETVAFQARVTAPDGSAVPDGDYAMRFRIYAEESGGEALWTETQSSVAVRDGLSNTILFGETPAPEGLFGNWDSLWLEIALDSDLDGFGAADVFAPRSRLNAVTTAFYAHDAGALGGMAAEGYATSADTYTRGDIDTRRATQDAAIAMKADTTEVEASQAAQDAVIAMKADATEVAESLAAQDAAIAQKADASDFLQWEVAAEGPVQTQRNRGYIIDSLSEVTIVLPESAHVNVGDVVRINGVGAGGWRLAQNEGQQIAGSGLQIPNNEPWIPREESRAWVAIASSADGTKLVAAATANEQEYLYTSTDAGATWTRREIRRHWQDVASSADGTTLIAAASASQLFVSTDSGVTWNPVESTRNWGSVASSADGSKLIASTSLNLLYTSADSGVTWTPRDEDRNWSGLASSADGTRLVATVLGGQILTSVDSGETWTPREEVRSWRGVASSADGSRLVALEGDGRIYTSVDAGITWIARESARDWRDVASSADGTRLVAVVQNGHVYTSFDGGATWMPQDSSRRWFSVASSADGASVIAGVFNGQLFTHSLFEATSTGATGGLSGSRNAAVELQYVGSDTFLPLSVSGGLGVF